MTTSIIHQQIRQRKERGAAIISADVRNVAQVSHTLYLVRGSEGSDYKVTLMGDSPRCECTDFARNGSTLQTCKHIEAVRLFNRIYQAIETNGTDLLTMRAIAGATVGSALHQKTWQAALSILRHKTGEQSPVILPFVARNVAEQAVAA